MLTIEECRKLLGGLNISNERIEAIRDYLYSLTKEIIKEELTEYENTIGKTTKS